MSIATAPSRSILATERELADPLRMLSELLHVRVITVKIPKTHPRHVATFANQTAQYARTTFRRLVKQETSPAIS